MLLDLASDDLLHLGLHLIESTEQSQNNHVIFYINFLLASSSIILQNLFKYLSPPYKQYTQGISNPYPAPRLTQAPVVLLVLLHGDLLGIENGENGGKIRWNMAHHRGCFLFHCWYSMWRYRIIFFTSQWQFIIYHGCPYIFIDMKSSYVRSYFY